MSDEAALLAAIQSHPDEDTPRLMYADWLQENGQPDRAEFIRIQCDATADEAAEDRAATLEDRNRVKWLTGLPQFSEARWEFRRGFPEHLDVDISLVLERYTAFVRVPWLRFLSLSEVDNSTVRDFVNRPWNPQWVEVELFQNWDTYEDPDYDSTPSVVAIARSRQVKQLRRLRMSFSTISAAGWRALDPLLKEFGDRLEVD